MLKFAHRPAGTHGGHRDALTGRLHATSRIMRCAEPAGEVHTCI